MKSGPVLALLVGALLTACQTAPKPGAKADAVVSETASAVASEVWVKSELYFGVAPWEAEGLGLSAAEGSWRAFLDEEVTPRFPDGFTVLDGYGQWRERAGGEIYRSRSRVLVVVHPDTAAKRADIEALREAFRARTGAKSVLAVETVTATPRF